MSARTLLEVALRILGVWCVVSTVHTLTTSASIYLAGGWGQTGVDMAGWFFASGLSSFVQLMLGVALICFAPAIAASLYPDTPDADQSLSRVGPGDLYHTACFVLGVFLLVSAAQPAGRIVNAGLRGIPFEMAGDIFTMIVYMAAGVALVIGARRLGELLSSLNHDPDSIPRQRISLTILLVLSAVVAVVLGVLRWLTMGGV